MKKKISIIGASLYGCLLAYQLYSKKYDVTIFEKGDKLLTGFDHIEIDKYKINNGFHGLEYPRSKELINFLNKKIKTKLINLPNVRKLLIDREIINFTDKYENFPPNIKKIYNKKNLKNYKNQSFDFFFKKNFIKKIHKNSKRFSDNLNHSKHNILPWFLPADVKHISKDEGAKFRNKVRSKKIIPKFFIPKNGLFSEISKFFLQEFKRRKIKVKFNSSISFDNNKINIKNKYNKNLKFKKSDKIIFCGSPAILLGLADPKIILELKKFTRLFYNLLIRIPKKGNNIDYFSEIICLNSKIPNVNRISRVYHLENSKFYFLQIEILLNKKEKIEKKIKSFLPELTKIFSFKSCKLIGFKHSRTIFTPTPKWISKATITVKKFIQKKDLTIGNFSFQPLNTTKIWNLSKLELKKF